MKTYLPIIRQIITLFIISFFILTLSCSDDPSSPKKEDEDPLPEETVTIGVEGGTVEKGDLKLTIPAGAFDEDYNISVSEVEDDGAFGDNAVTPSYKISGIPGDYSKPLKLVAKYSGDLSGKSYLGIGQKSLDIIEESSSIVFNMYRSI
ncbi:MAG: hypothetical protein H6613_07660 [Ignavibacteriales bacterium]|nr:hypothetical protein [Ignavibacteriales bacterium]